jgi:hypothetical protein
MPGCVRGLWALNISWPADGVGRAHQDEALLTHLRDQHAKQESHVGQLPVQPENGEEHPGQAEGGAQADTCGTADETNVAMEEEP